MDDLHQRDPEFTMESTLHGLNPPQDQVTGAFFPNAQNFVVTGGRFKSITNIHHAAPAEPPDFPTIPMGYLNLLRELRLNADTGVIDHHQSPVRRAHSARIHGSESTMTVAIYEGNKAEENWREAISQHSNLRHPNIIQLFGIARTSKIHAAIFHDELIPAQQMAEKYDVSPICTVYFRHFLGTRSLALRHYVRSVSRKYPFQGQCTLWIRPSTGAICLDLTPDEFDFEPDFAESRHAATGDHLLDPNQDSDIIADMSVSDYHVTCYYDLSKRLKLSISAHTSLKLGTVYRNLRADCDSPVEVAFVSDSNWTDYSWESPNGTVPGQIIEDGWVCIPSAEVHPKYSRLISTTFWDGEEWLTQANHIFKCLDITSNYEDYAILRSVQYRLTFSGPTDGLPSGYLFLCPLEDFHSDAPTFLRLPDCPAYWSLDPTRFERLSAEEAKDLGFPSFELKVVAYGNSWDSSVYDGLRQFHEAKGFDPYNQDIARHMGHRLFQLSDRMEAVSAHLQEINSDDGYDEAVYSEISTVQDTPSTETIQSQTTQFADFSNCLGLDVDILAGFDSFGTSSNYFWADTAVDSFSLPSSSSSTFMFPSLPPPQQTYLPSNSPTIQNPPAGSSHHFNTPLTPPGHLDAIDPQNIPTTDFRARTVSKRAEHWYNTDLYSAPSILPSGSGMFPDAAAPPELASRDFAPYPTHLGLEVEFPANRSFGTASDYLWVDTTFDSFSIPSSSTTFSFPSLPPPHPAYLPYNSETIQNASADSSHPFDMPTIPPAQLNADPQNIPARDLIARNARKRKAESQMSEGANKNMRLDFTMEGGG